MIKPYIKTLQADTETPVTLYMKYVKQDIGFMLESKEEGKGRFTILGGNPYMIVKANENVVTTYELYDKTYREKNQIKAKPLEYIKKLIKEVSITNDTELPFVGGAVGTVGYDIIRDYEKLPMINPSTNGIPDLHQMFFKEVLIYDHLYNKLHISVLEEDDDKGKEIADNRHKEIVSQITADNTDNSFNTIVSHNIDIVSTVDTIKQKDYEEMVSKAKQYIKNGDIFQVVLSQRKTMINHDKIDSYNLYRQLRHANPSAYLFYINYGEYQVVGSSPEKLVEVREDRIINCPIAGTRKRGNNKEEDTLLANDLLADPKEIAEHVMLVDLGRNDMGRVAKVGSVEVTEFKEVHNYPHVMHLVSQVEGNKRSDKDMFDVLMSFLPAGTLSGAPKIRAMEIIEELETVKRGIYGGAIGYFGFDGNMDTCIAIRTMIVRDNEIDIQAGAGIVADSIPEKEYEETCNKLKGLVSAIQAVDKKEVV